MPESLERALPTARRGVQDWTVLDSAIERTFAQKLEESVEVCAFAHLPRSFKIPTPVGDYAPDWAIAFNEGAVRYIYFVAETKGSLQSLNLKGTEREDRVRAQAVRAAGRRRCALRLREHLRGTAGQGDVLSEACADADARRARARGGHRWGRAAGGRGRRRTRVRGGRGRGRGSACAG